MLTNVYDKVGAGYSVSRRADARIADRITQSLGDSGDFIVLDYDNPGAAEQFFEPFTQTSYLLRQELIIERLPSTGSYTLVVFDRAMQADSAKYVLAIGEREEFSLADYFTTLPAAWFETKLFFNDYISIAAALAVVFGVASLFIGVFVRKMTRAKIQSR